MSLENLNNSGSFLPCLVALFLSGGSLVLYLAGAVVSRFALGEEGKTTRSFNLGVPLGQKPEELFAISMVSAQTTLSTVFVLFLTSAGVFGFHLLFCPVAFGVGVLFMLFVYRRVEQRGYLDQSTPSGLIPYLGHRLTNSRPVGYSLVVASVLPLLAILALELLYGIRFLDYLVHHVFSTSSSFEQRNRIFDPTFIPFTTFMLLLLGYVFVGGFRAVVTSDVWQYKVMKTTLSLAFVSVLVLAFQKRHELHWNSLPNPSAGQLLVFYIGVTIINLFTPLCLATTWQRFRAFRDCPTDFNAAVRVAIPKAIYLWAILIAIGLGLQVIPGAARQPDQDALQYFLDRLVGQNDWFRLFVFPLITFAAFSGMYSASDTCVSALLYLTESGRTWDQKRQHGEMPPRRHHYWTMIGILVLALAMYPLVKLRTTAENGLMLVAMEIFGTAVVLAPTVLLLTKFDPPTAAVQARSRTWHVLVSIVVGLTAYWSFMLIRIGQRYPMRSWAIVGGLLASSLPACMLLWRESPRQKGKRTWSIC
jgi:Na+/pantothenate symporter